jgi:hypothetical protein
MRDVGLSAVVVVVALEVALVEELEELEMKIL